MGYAHVIPEFFAPPAPPAKPRPPAPCFRTTHAQDPALQKPNNPPPPHCTYELSSLFVPSFFSAHLGTTNIPRKQFSPPCNGSGCSFLQPASFPKAAWAASFPDEGPGGAGGGRGGGPAATYEGTVQNAKTLCANPKNQQKHQKPGAS